MTNQNIEITVIITAYNSENELPRAIDSVIAQNFKDFEIIVVDDGSSTDACQHIVENYQKDIMFIRYFYQANSGPAAARNRGLKESKGKYVCFLDSDDLYKPNKLQIQYNILTKLSSDYAFICGGSELIEDGKRGVKQPQLVSGEVYPDILYESYFGMNGTPGHLFDKKFLLEEKFDETLRNNEDLDVLVRLAQKYKILTHSDIVCTIIKSDNSLTRADPVQNLRSSLRFIEKLKRNDSNLSSVFLKRKRQKAYFNAAKLSLTKFGDFNRYQYFMKMGIKEYRFPRSWRGQVAAIYAYTGWLGKVTSRLIFSGYK